MKRKTYIIVAIILAYFAGVFSWVIYERRDGTQEQLEALEKEIFEKKFKCPEGFGVTEDGTYFMHKDLVATPKRVLLILQREQNYSKGDSLKVVDERDSQEIIQMERVGDYFIVKPGRKYLDPIFHFETEIEMFFPRN